MRFPFGRSRTAPTETAAARLHDALIAQIRRPVFYTDFGVPDTFEGRFDLLVLHAGLVLRRLRDLGPEGRAMAQSLVDLMFARFDIAMRELGVSDIGVPKRMKRMAEAFKGRTAAYDQALARDDLPTLAAALARNILGDTRDGSRLALYARAGAAALATATLDQLGDGRPALPDPAAVREVTE